MPYVKPEDRMVPPLPCARSVGHLNFLITSLVADWIAREGKSYTSINAAIGALECAKLELYRRVAVPYEDDKCAANGDVYPKALTEGPLSIG